MTVKIVDGQGEQLLFVAMPRVTQPRLDPTILAQAAGVSLEIWTRSRNHKPAEGDVVLDVP